MKTVELSSRTGSAAAATCADGHPAVFQSHGASLAPRQPQPRSARQRRMTPFWRGVSLRPIGASCRDNSECLTMLCRKNRCLLSTASA
ncbi:liver-expressed antimicrobial peptide 2 isoform X1 [Melospiza georgiana]|uniref:liver-expressed antimicrobial peptide 2 isoform X1 n=1 Tax=Melospiza georgiana TaxID=44398 RepID=UPI0025AD390A|nr:liver-expressed antimicrobial peptide 2 isoform X1 [Melospiza georgiana]